MSKLVVWDTPFKALRFPSVWISTNGGLDEDLVVSVGYPAEWEVRFQKVVGLKVCDETFDDNSRFHIDGNEDIGSSAIWIDSPWLNEFNPEYASFMLAMDDHKVTH